MMTTEKVRVTVRAAGVATVTVTRRHVTSNTSDSESDQCWARLVTGQSA